jgi:two-component sensor histidine kinase
VKPFTLRTGLILVVIGALLPIGTLSVVQALATLDYSQMLIGNRLITSALATAGQERDALIIAKHVALTLSQNAQVRSAGPGCREGLMAGMSGNPSLANFARSDANGNVLCSVLPFEPKLSLAGKDYWQRGIAQKDFSISAPVMGQISKRPILIGMLPLKNTDGSNNGAITVGIDLAWLQTSLQAASKTAEAVIAVTDQNGKVIIASGQGLLPPLNSASAEVQITEGIAKDGKIWLYASAPLYKQSLYIVYAEPKNALMATALEQVRINLILPVIAILLASLALWFGTNRLVIRWLESLRRLAGEFTRGDYRGDPQHCKKAPLEIAQLSDDLHIMAKAIESRDHEIHHRVKNNLQIVSSLLNLQARKISDPAAKTALDQTRARIGALAQIHRLLYEETPEIEHGQVDIARLMGELCVQMRALHRHQARINLVCTAAHCAMPVDSVVPLSLFAVEAVTNAYRHAFVNRDAGTITLKFCVENNDRILRIIDDGIGFDATRPSQSMGYQLMVGFANQIGGTLKIESDKTGTVVTLSSPIPDPA